MQSQYDGVTNLRKIEQTREYLNQRGVSSRILLNPRSYEVIEEILDQNPFIQLNEEAEARLNERIQVKKGMMEIGIDNDRKRNEKLKIGKHSNGITITREIWQEGILSREKRFFNGDGIEMRRIYENINIELEQWSRGSMEGLPFEWMIIERDAKRPDLIQKKYQKIGETILEKKFYQRKRFMDFHDVWVSKAHRKRFGLQEEGIFLNLENQRIYEMVKSELEENTENDIREYEMYNKRYGLTKRYESGMSKLCLKSKLIGGE